jgi:hypothetical protein
MMLRRLVEVYLTEPCQPIANVLAKYKTAGLDLSTQMGAKTATTALREARLRFRKPLDRDGMRAEQTPPRIDANDPDVIDTPGSEAVGKSFLVLEDQASCSGCVVRQPFQTLRGATAGTDTPSGGLFVIKLWLIWPDAMQTGAGFFG